MDVLPTCNVYAHVCLYYACLVSAFGSQNRMLVPLNWGLELQIVVNCHVDAGNRIESFRK